MTRDCFELTEILVSRTTGTIEPAELARLESHLGSCGSCTDLAKDLEDALASTKPEPRFSNDSWEELRAEIEKRKLLAPPDLKVLLTCTFCHGSLERPETVYCASCLAPHHGECFESHGRCSATGCTETLTVQPRATKHSPQANAVSTTVAVPRPRKRTWPWFLLGVGAVAVAGFAGTRALGWPGAWRAPSTASSSPATAQAPATTTGASITFVDENVQEDAEQEPPPYPWPEAAPGSPQEMLERKRVTVRFEATPFLEAISYLEEVTGIKLVVSQAVVDIVDGDQLKVSLRLKNVRAWDALGYVLAVRDDFGFVCNAHAVRILTVQEVPGGPPVNARLLLEDQGEGSWQRSYRTRLATQKVSFLFEKSSLAEVVQFLEDFTGLNFVVSKNLDANGVKISLTWRDVALGSALTELLWSQGLRWDLRCEAIYIGPRDEDAVPELTRHAEGVTRGSISHVAQELGLDGCVASRDAWSSRGTFTFKDSTIGNEPGATIGYVPGRPRQAVLVFAAPIPGAQETLALVPPPLAGIAAEVREIQARLKGELEARRKARAEGLPDLARREEAVYRSARRIDSLVKLTQSLSTASERLAEARSALTLEKDRVAKVTEEAARLVAESARALDALRLVEAKQESEAKENGDGSRLAAAKKKTWKELTAADVVELELAGNTVGEMGKDGFQRKLPEGISRADVDREVAARRKQKEDAAKVLEEAQRKQRAATFAAAAANGNLAHVHSRIEELTALAQGAEKDLALRERLEGGARLAEAEKQP
ncbi:hypothetical protein HY251_19280 [bacterium]|nr:hypothetical protein [bacterium]